MTETTFFKVRTVIQNDNKDTFLKLDYFSTEADKDDLIDGSFIISTRGFYEQRGFVVVSIHQKQVSEDEYKISESEYIEYTLAG